MSDLDGKVALDSGAARGIGAAIAQTRGLTKAAAVDLGKYGIRGSSVHPNFIATGDDCARAGRRVVD
jgi:NAD(P)-dependent dehydrogenase (short-subunit alcohol dehydrogenase family)